MTEMDYGSTATAPLPEEFLSPGATPSAAAPAVVLNPISQVQPGSPIPESALPLAHDPIEVLPVSFLETPEEAQANAAQVSEDLSGSSVPEPSNQTARLSARKMAVPDNPRVSRRGGDSMRGRASQKSQKQVKMEKRAKVLILIGFVLCNAILVSGVLWWKGILPVEEWLGL